MPVALKRYRADLNSTKWLWMGHKEEKQVGVLIVSFTSAGTGAPRVMETTHQ